MKEKTTEIIQIKAEWQDQLKALEDRLMCELAAKEASFQTAQELERQGRKKEEELFNKANGGEA